MCLYLELLVHEFVFFESIIVVKVQVFSAGIHVLEGRVRDLHDLTLSVPVISLQVKLFGIRYKLQSKFRLRQVCG